MKLNIISDSSIAYNEKLEDELKVKNVPFFLDLDGRQYVDDENFDVKDFLSKMKKSDDIAKSRAPSPQSFIDKMEKDKDNFIITISSKLSATYQNALIAKNMVEDDIKNIHIFDSKSAVAGQTVIAMKINEYFSDNDSFESIVKKVEDLIENMDTYFVLDDFTNLIKNGRARKVAGALSKALKITPIAKAVDGNIDLLARGRGLKNGISKMIDLVVERSQEKLVDICVIAHVFNEDMAIYAKKQLEEKASFNRIEIVEPSGLGAMYANDQGIVISF